MFAIIPLAYDMHLYNLYGIDGKGTDISSSWRHLTATGNHMQ